MFISGNKFNLRYNLEIYVNYGKKIIEFLEMIRFGVGLFVAYLDYDLREGLLGSPLPSQPDLKMATPASNSIELLLKDIRLGFFTHFQP